MAGLIRFVGLIVIRGAFSGKEIAKTLLNTVFDMSESEIEKFPVYLEVTNPKTTNDKYALGPNAWGLVGMVRVALRT